MKHITVNIYNIQWEGYALDECDWYCDECGAHLNIQSRFNTAYGTWECEECGYENEIDSSNIEGIDLPSVEDYVILDCEEYELNDEITSYLEFKYNHNVDYFDFDIVSIEDDEDDEDDSERMSDDDFALADFCHGGDLTED